jgi:tRNA(adenine34) deaminase
VWEYDGEWPHRRCSTECHDDWEEEECVDDQWEAAGNLRLSSGRWEEEDDDVDGSNHRCRGCGRRKNLEKYYNGGEPYSGRRRERTDVDGCHGNYRDSDRRRQLQRDYHDEEGDIDLRRRRQSRGRRDRRQLDFDDTIDTRMVVTRRYDDDGRKYDSKRVSRDLDHDDGVDVRRADRYAEDARRFDRRTDNRDFETEDEVDLRREGRRYSNDDQRYIMRRQRREYDGDDGSLLRLHHRRDEGFDYDDQDLAECRHYIEGRSKKSARESDLPVDDAKKASSSRTMVDARHGNNSSPRVGWGDNVDRQTSEIRDQRYSVGWSSDHRQAHDYDEAQYVKVRDARTGTQDVKVITEYDSRLVSSSNNKTILKDSSNVDQKTTVLNDKSRNSSQNITEISEVRGNNIEQDTRAQRYCQEDRRNVENRSSSLQSSVKMGSDSRRQIDQRSEVNQQVASLTESRKNAEKFTAVTTDSSRNVSSASHTWRSYDEVNRTDIDDRSASVQNITHVTRDKKRIINQQVIHETDIDVQNVAHVDVTKVHASDISVSRNSQNHSHTGSNVNVASSMNVSGNARIQEEQVYENKVCANDTAVVKGSQSHLGAGVSGWVHSTSSTNISDDTKDSHDQVELSKACTNSAGVGSTSESHLQTTADGQVWFTSAVNTIGNVNEQCDLAKIHSSDGSVVITPQNLDTRNGNQFCGTSTVNLLREHQGMSDHQSGSVTQRNDEQRIKSSESSQVSREKLVRLEDTERLMQHNMDLICQQANTSGTSHDKDTTSLPIDSTEAGSSMVDTNMAHRVMITGSNEQDLRTESTAGSSVASGSNARQSVKESMLESAARLEKSSTFHVGQFVDELQKGVSDADTVSTKKNEKPMVEGITSSSSRSQMKGPADEMWDVQSTTSQETFKTADKEEGFSADGATNSASQTPKNESALAKNVHKSLWAFVADIIRLGWIQRGESHDSTDKSVKKSSSSNSQSTEGWLSSQEHDNDGIRKKYGSTRVKDQQLIKSHSGEPESKVVSLPMEENLHTGTQGLQIQGAGIAPQVSRSEGDLLATSSKADQNISAEGLKQSIGGESPLGSSIEGSTPSFVDVTIGHSLDPKAVTSSSITVKGSGENIGKGNTSSVTMSSTESVHNGSGADWIYVLSGTITPYHHPQTQVGMPHDSTLPAMLESPSLVGGSSRFEEKNVVQETPEVTKTEGKDAELKRRIFQRNKQVLKETFDEWEEAYQRDAEMRKADELFMREALLEAQRAADIWEVPVGAVLVQNGEIIARGCNL